jgi:hypothetical protein
VLGSDTFTGRKKRGMTPARHSRLSEYEARRHGAMSVLQGFWPPDVLQQP